VFVAPDDGLRSFLETFLPRDSFRLVATGNKVSDLFRKCAAELRRGDYQLVHSHGFTAGAVVTPLCRLSGVPHILTAHDVFQDSLFAGAGGVVRRFMLRQVLDRVDVINTVSRDGMNNIKEYFPSVKESRIKPVLNGIDSGLFSAAKPQAYRDCVEDLSDSHYLIGFFGRFMAQKGFRYLLDAMEILRAGHQKHGKIPVVLTFGEGGYVREEYRNIEQRGLSDCFVRLPYTDDMAAAIKGVDLVVMPSLWEACPILAMEALVAGVPLIGTACLGLREVLEDTPASVIEPADPGMLAEAIEHEMDTDRRAEFEAYSCIAAKRYSIDKTVSQLVRLYHETAG
jgi:glycosyltransferase involved in cell wall biosynthesis